MSAITSGAVPLRILPLVGALLLGACEGGTATPTPGAATSTTSAAAATSASPTTTLIGGQEASLRDVADSETAVRGYFDAFATSDLAGLGKYSAGEVRVLAGWQDFMTQQSGALTPVAATVDSLEIVSVEADTATVKITGDLVESVTVFRGNNPSDQEVTTDLSGAVTVARGTTWQVSNFHRDGRWAGDQLFTKVRGKVVTKGVAVTVLGVDLRPKGTVVFIEVNNTTAKAASAINAMIVDAGGKQLLTTAGRDVEALNVPEGVKTSAGLFFLKGLPTTARKFTFRVTFVLCRNNSQVCSGEASVKIPVKLVH